ncbi:MAG: calcium-binding protein, partial [Alteraurantiacibacter sp.]
ISEATGVVGDLWNATPEEPDFVGTAGDDIAMGDAAANRMQGEAGDDLLNGGDGIDTAVWAGEVYGFTFDLDGSGNLTVTDTVGNEGTDTLVATERASFAGLEKTIISGTDGNDTLLGRADGELMLGHDGDDLLVGNGIADVLIGGAGNDELRGSGGQDIIIWRVGDGQDRSIGGESRRDTFHVIGDETAETYGIYTKFEAEQAGFTGFHRNTQIVVTRNGEVVSELQGIEELVIDGMGGGDTFEVFGDFRDTSLAYNTITLNGGNGNDTVNIDGLSSQHRVVFTGNGGSDSLIGDLRAQDTFVFENGESVSGHDLVRGDDFRISGSDGAHEAAMSTSLVAGAWSDGSPDLGAMEFPAELGLAPAGDGFEIFGEQIMLMPDVESLRLAEDPFATGLPMEGFA